MTIADTLRQLGLASPDPRSDGELVSRFVANRDEPAFVELFRRHGSMVYGVCRRVLGNTPDADDAFQAVFLVLARSAASVRPPGMVGNWLYDVAVRTANKARVMNANKVNRRCEPPGGLDQHPAVHTAGSPDRDTLAVIDAELASLPAEYRAAFVACELNGRSRSEAARELGWPEGTVAARLAKARQLLAAKLTKRGVTLGAGLFAVATVPTATATDTMAAVRELLAVGTASAVAPAAQTLSDEVVKSMTTNHAMWLLLAGLVLTLASGGAIVLGHPADPPPVAKAPAPKEKEQPMEWKEADPIEYTAGKVTSVVCSPSGKMIGVCRDNGAISFHNPANRFFITNKEVADVGKKVATVTVIAFRPTPHPTLGEVFAVTHKDGVIFGTTSEGLLSDDAAVVGVPPNWAMKGADPHQLAWLTDDSIVATNGADVWWRVKAKEGWEGQDWTEAAGERGRRVPLAALPGQSLNYVTVGVGRKKESELQIVARSPQSSPQTRLEGHKARPVAAASAADGQRIVSADEGGTIIVWEGEKLEFKEKRRIELGEGVVQLALAADGKTVAVVRAYSDTDLFGTSGRTLFNLELFVFDLTNPPAKPKTLWSPRGMLSDGKTFTSPASLAFSPDGKTLLAAFADPYINDKDAKSMGVKVWELVPKK